MTETFPTEKSILSIEGIKKYILSEYDLEENCKCLFYRPGLNDTYKIEESEKLFYLRIYNSKWRTKHDVESEIILIKHLSANGLDVASPVENKNNQFIMEINAPEGIRYAVLFKSALGRCVDKLDEKQSLNYGKMVSSIHESSDKLDKLNRFNLDMNHLLEQPLSNIKPFFKNREADFNYLRTTANSLSSKIFELIAQSELDYGICHGDFHHGNVFFDEEDNISVFDFDCFGYSWRAYDLSVFLWSCVPPYNWKEEDNRKRMQLWESFLDGYSSLKPISKDEIKAAFVFVAIRHIWFLGLQTIKTDTKGQEWLNDNYFDYAIKFIKKWIETYKVLD
ncbi:phosphotransferase enzyme family protein [Flavivirga jejuensis]|uniref:Phosphotransferase n=1 Tax=Flavivirga jejuensis TaxID=870487 RepID=A0ABT8WVG6_9FLAO|nr:phosphotransferase [Flavivirga jejuensis]MDO5976886.1 phosphotransferase [Flavivirga jejuensis]